MLNELSITNFAIIDELHVSFDEGLNVISGETGAGKSILIGAVSLLLGDQGHGGDDSDPDGYGHSGSAL